MYRIESLLSARLFLKPQIVNNQIYFLSNLGGHISLYGTKFGGSVPEPLLPPHIALQNPHLIDGESFYVFPELSKILIMIDKDGDENYQPMTIPIDGGFPEPAFGDLFDNYRVHCSRCDPEANLVYFEAESRSEQMITSYQANLESGNVQQLGASMWGSFVDGVNRTHDKAILIDLYTAGDHVLYLWTQEATERQLLYGSPLEERKPDQHIQINAILHTHFISDDRSLIFVTALHKDTYGIGYLEIENPQDVKPVDITGTVHTGKGELNELKHLQQDRYLLIYNIDGCSWVYEASFDEKALTMEVNHVLVGAGELSNGVLEAIHYDKIGDRFALSFSTATSPIQIYSLENKDRNRITRHTNERILGIPEGLLSLGEDASYTSLDDTYISARLYLPSTELGYQRPYPLIYYVHGGPQSQERPDFAWFSMPLIQYLTLTGFAVFVPNVRGSAGYGLDYMKQVDRDWGGKDRLDHVHAMKEVLPKDERLDVSRAGVVGRSYGGYMTLTLAGRHPDLWSAAIDMFGPYDLLSFMDRIPETWKPYFKIAIGDPQEDCEFLIERSPRTHLDQVCCPLMVIQGKNDPRVVEEESSDLVEYLKSIGKEVDYLVFENEGHDVLKFENRVTTYNAIAGFFKKHLAP